MNKTEENTQKALTKIKALVDKFGKVPVSKASRRFYDSVYRTTKVKKTVTTKKVTTKKKKSTKKVIKKVIKKS